MKLSNYLHIFNHVISKGSKRDNTFYLDELSAWHDIDGYTCYLGYKDLTMSLYFHNRFSYEYQDKTTLLEFTSIVDKFSQALSRRK